MKVRAFIRLTRPVFLLGGALLYWLGIAVAASRGVSLDGGRAWIGQWMVTAIQLMAQYANEYYDMEVDRLSAGNRTAFSGGSGVLQTGNLSPDVALWAARITAVAAIIAIIVATAIYPLAGIIGTVALAGSWYYSAPPLALMGSGWGELTTSMIVALLAPLAGYALQVGTIDPMLFLLCLPLVLLHWAMMIAFDIPDYDADKSAGKRTLAVRIGRDRSALLHNAMIAIAVIATVALAVNRTLPLLSATLIPLAIWQIAAMSRSKRTEWSRLPVLTFGAVALFSVTALMFLVGFVMPAA